jgi:hypothetical protein
LHILLLLLLHLGVGRGVESGIYLRRTVESLFAYMELR